MPSPNQAPSRQVWNRVSHHGVKRNVHQRRLALMVSLWPLVAWCDSRHACAQGAQLQFNRDIRPILAENCYPCHGPDKNHREADLRLDDQKIALELGAIVPSDPDASELMRRIESDDPSEVMPPHESHKSLNESQIQLLRQWIREGAAYERHWAYEPPVRPPIANDTHPIDALVEKNLAPLNLHASAEADRRTLIRRLSFDLLGLRPTPQDVRDFVDDPSPDAWDRLVERLLESPHFGERMAQSWLDVVRYADTIGYHSDNPQAVWPYRDYVIRSFNENKPFDQFTIEQLAGDLLPNPTPEQLVASCFNRLLLTTEEGGAQANDYEARMLADRVRAVGTVWLGQTLGCSQCHDHKFDPVTQHDFYSLGAFFADLDEPIIGRREAGMVLATPDEEAKLAALRTAAEGLRLEYDAMSPELVAAAEAWERAVLASLEYRERRQALAKEGTTAAGGDKTEDPNSLTPPDEILSILRIDVQQRTPDQAAAVIAHFKQQLPELSDLRGRLQAAEQALVEFEASLPHCLVSKSLATPRTVRVLPRGNWMDESGPIVVPALPRYLSGQSPSADGARLNRLDLARWIVSRDNPLTARVFVNRLWKHFFGLGISKSLDDLGSQGEWPMNPELLDHLACEFMDRGWDVKRMVHHIVTSRTYRQASTAPQELLARDPDNRLLARQSRFRLDAELVRDNALAIAGLLEPTIGGPSVKPYQPDGYWEYLNFPERTYAADHGPAQYRRGIYTWWQRTFAHPSLLAFDAPSREECCAERPRSNIPQQALVLLNDPTYVEAARAFAARILDAGGDDNARIEWAWQQALGRTPREEELEIAAALVAKHRAEVAENRDSAESLLAVGQAPVGDGVDHVELAAWTSVARLILNLHETITRN
jgi:hypothetical protein